MQIIAKETKQIQHDYGNNTELGKRKTTFAKVENVKEIDLESIIEKEPITIICSKNGHFVRGIDERANILARYRLNRPAIHFQKEHFTNLRLMTKRANVLQHMLTNCELWPQAFRT